MKDAGKHEAFMGEQFELMFNNYIKMLSRFTFFTCIWLLRVRAKITSQNWRSDLVQIWLIRESKTTAIASYFEANFIRSGASEVSAKDGLKLR